MDKKGPCSIYKFVSKLVTSIEKQVKNGFETKRIKEMSLLYNFCWNENPVVSVTACQGITLLVQNQSLTISEAMSTLITSSSLLSAENISGIINTLINLMLIQMRAELFDKQVYTCPYKTQTYPLHPIVVILKQRPLMWRDVLNHMNVICQHSDKEISNNSLKLLRIVFQFVLQEKNSLPKDCNNQVWNLIVNFFLEDDLVLEIMTSFLSENGGQILEMDYYLSVLCEAVIRKNIDEMIGVLPLLVCIVIHRLLQLSYTPQSALIILKKLTSLSICSHSTVLMLISHSITICAAVYVRHLLDFCLWLLQQGHCTLDSIWMCVSAVLPWLVVSSSQMQETVETATKIVSITKSAKTKPSLLSSLICNRFCPLVMSADQRLVVALHLTKLSETNDEDLKNILWLETRSIEPFEELHLLYATSLIIGGRQKYLKLAALSFLTKCNSKFSTHNLTVILYQLAKERIPEMQLSLLNYIPTAALDKENIPVIISVIEALRCSKNNVLKLFSVKLSLKLWIIQEQRYTTLLEQLFQNLQYLTEEDIYEFNVVVAATCKEICNLEPQKHGKELVMQISEIISRCKTCIPCVLALNALITLCKEGVIDVHSIWKHLAPKMCKDRRPTVLDRFCELVGYIAIMANPSADKMEVLIHVVTWLWQNVVSSSHILVVRSSLKTLSKFKVGQIPLKSLPECFRRNIKLPPEMARTPEEAVRKPEDILPFIPGICWLQMLQHIQIEARESAVETIDSWLTAELLTFGRGIYAIERGEPLNYKHLNISSICRAFCEFIRTLPKTSSEGDITTIKLCLKVLIKPHPKPLPPLNWSFMNKLFDREDTELTALVISLLAKQAQISPTARIIVESYISENLTNDKIEFLFSLLPDLCRGIPSNSLQPFMDTTIHTAIKDNDLKLFKMILSTIKNILHKEIIHEANSIILRQHIQDLWPQIGSQHELFNDYLSCVYELPTSSIEEMSSTSNLWELTQTVCQKVIKLRCFMALAPDTPDPITWLNGVIDIGTSNATIDQSVVIEELTTVLSRLHDHPSVWDWLVKLLGQIYNIVEKKQVGLNFLVNIFVIAVDWFSGYAFLGLNENFVFLRFPRAITHLVKCHGDSKLMAEWLKFLTVQHDLDSRYPPMFNLAAKAISSNLTC